MRLTTTSRSCRFMLIAAFAFVLCIGGAGMLTANAGTAQALFTSDARVTTAHAVKAFPMALSVDAEGYKARTNEIDREQLTVSLVFSDGTSRVLDKSEYELSSATIPDGYKGAFGSEATYLDGDIKLTAPFDVNVDEAYGAQYGTTLVFGRGLPAAIYDEAPLETTTWDIEETQCEPLWNKDVLVDVLDIDTVKPRGMKDWFNSSGTLKSVVLDEMDTSTVTDMSHAFDADTALVEVDLSGWDTSNVTTMFAMFQQCSALPYLDLSFFEMGNVTDMGYMFRYDNKLAPIEGMSDWDTGNVVNMSETFKRCYEFTTIDLSNWDVSSVRSFVGFLDMFPPGSSKLTSVGDLSDWDLTSARNIGCLFQYCDKLKSPGDLGEWDVSNVTSLSNTFQFCRSLTSVGDLSEWKVDNVTSMYEMFQNCESLTTIGDVSKWNTAKVGDMSRTFQTAPKLSVDCSAWETESVTKNEGFHENSPKVIPPTWKKGKA